MVNNTGTLRKVMFAYDNSEVSKEVFEWAKQNVFRPGKDQVTLFTNIENGESYMEPRYFEGFIHGNHNMDRYQKHMDEAAAKANKILDTLVNELTDLEIEATKVVVKGGHVQKTIVELSKSLPADLLVVGSRGLNAKERVMLGSVSEFCLHHCHCPVLVHKGDGKTN